jgi:transposase
MQLLAETGKDLSRWPSEKHFSSWLGLAPGQNDSGRMKKRSKRKGKPKAGQIFRVIAQSLITSKDIAIGAYGRKLRARKGPTLAIKAMARKLAELYWRVMVKGLEYAEQGVKKYEELLYKQKLRSLTRIAKKLNVQIQY